VWRGIAREAIGIIRYSELGDAKLKGCAKCRKLSYFG